MNSIDVLCESFGLSADGFADEKIKLSSPEDCKNVNDMLCDKDGDFEGLWRDASMEFDETEYLLECSTNKIKFLPTGNLHLSTGKAKTGKTTANCILISSILGHGENFGFRALKDDATVLYIDTEQDDADHIRVLRYINRMCGYADNQCFPFHCLIKLVSKNIWIHYPWETPHAVFRIAQLRVI